MTVFKIYLKELEDHLSKFSKHHRVNIFLIKLTFRLKDKLLNINNISNNREKILIIIIMQKKTLKRVRQTSENYSEASNRNNHI